MQHYVYTSVNDYQKVALIAVPISVIGGSYLGYLVGVSTEPMVKDIYVPDSATRKLVKQAEYEHYRLGNISYLTSGPILSQFVYSCEPGAGYASSSPSCLAFVYDGTLGIIELEIPKYLIREFPIIDEVYFKEVFSIFGKQIPFQVIRGENSYVKVRIDVPSNYTGFMISGRSEDSLFTPFINKSLGSGLVLSSLLFFLCLIVYWISKKCILYIRNKF
jgi:hypothetical protein